MKHVYHCVEISDSDVKKCYEFATEAARTRSQSWNDFGRTDKKRGIIDQVADIIEGKLAEIGFARFCERHTEMTCELDFEHYSSREVVDFGNDVQFLSINGKKYVNPMKIDVKSTRRYSKWLLIEQFKFWSSVYVLIKVNLDRDFEKFPSKVLDSNVKCFICGFCYYYDFFDLKNHVPYVVYRKGDRLFDYDMDGEFCRDTLSFSDFVQTMLSDERRLGMEMKAHVNYAMPVKFLRNQVEEWTKLFGALKSVAQKM